jgi:hypothetical protein
MRVFTVWEQLVAYARRPLSWIPRVGRISKGGSGVITGTAPVRARFSYFWGAPPARLSTFAGGIAKSSRGACCLPPLLSWELGAFSIR